MSTIFRYLVRMGLPALAGALVWGITWPWRLSRRKRKGKVAGPYREGAMLFLFMFLSGLLLRGVWLGLAQKKKMLSEQSVSEWLALTSLLFSYLVLLGGISYSEISGWNAILYWYLSGAYPVMIAFEVLAALSGVRILRNWNRRTI